MLKQARFLIDYKTELLLEKGSAETNKMLDLEHQMQTLKKDAESNFEMTDAEISDLRDEIRRHVLTVHDAEQEAVNALKEAVQS